MKEDKHPIAALSQRQISRPTRKKTYRNSLLLSFKKAELKLDFYSSLDTDLLKEILEQSIMTNLCDLGQVYIVCGKPDMRKGINTLAFLIKEKFEMSPFAGQVVLFCGEKQDRFKVLYWGWLGILATLQEI